MRRIVESIIAGFIAGILLKVLDKYGGIGIMKSLFQTFVIELWPMWIGLAIAVIYWFIRFLLEVRNEINEIKKKYTLIEDSKKESKEVVIDNRKIVDTGAVVEEGCGVYASHYGQINIYGESKDKKE